MIDLTPQELELLKSLLTRNGYGDAQTMATAASLLAKIEAAQSSEQT